MSTTAWVIVIAVSLTIIGLVLLFEFIVKRRRQQSAPSAPASAFRSQPEPIVSDGPAEAEAEDETAVADDEPDEETEEDNDMSAEELVAQGDEQMKKHDCDNAVDSFSSALDKVREEKGCDSLESADVLIKLGLAYQARDDGEDDDDYFTNCFTRALAIREQHWGPFDQRLVPVMHLLIAAEDQNGNQSDAEALLARCDAIAEFNGRDQTVKPADSFWSPSSSEFCAKGDKAMKEEHDSSSAADSHWEGLEAACEKHGNDSLEAAELWIKYGQAVQARDANDDDNEATTPDNYMRGLAIMVQLFGPEDERLVLPLTNLVSFFDQVGEYGKADSYIRRITRIYARKAVAR